MISDNIINIKNEINGRAELIIVTKNRSIEQILEVYNNGNRVFAENRVQALLEHKEQLPDDIHWHLIGHLQTNKVKYIAPFIEMIQSVDSEKLLDEINKQAAKNNRIIKVLLQVHIAKEETKFGFSEEELMEFLHSDFRNKYTHILVCGLMAMATNTDNLIVVVTEFKGMKKLFDTIKETVFKDDTNFKTLSMGMSSDYMVAIECGSNMVRVGSKVFE